MTPLAARMQERRIVTTDHRDLSAPIATVSLASLRPRESARVVGYSPDLSASHGRRLFDLGFAPGAVVHVVRRAPALDPTIYRVADGEVALRRSLASHVRVEQP